MFNSRLDRYTRAFIRFINRHMVDHSLQEYHLVALEGLTDLLDSASFKLNIGVHFDPNFQRNLNRQKRALEFLIKNFLGYLGTTDSSDTDNDCVNRIAA